MSWLRRLLLNLLTLCASLALATIIPLFGEKGDHEINDIVYAIAAERSCPSATFTRVTPPS